MFFFASLWKSCFSSCYDDDTIPVVPSVQNVELFPEQSDTKNRFSSSLNTIPEDIPSFEEDTKHNEDEEREADSTNETDVVSDTVIEPINIEYSTDLIAILEKFIHKLQTQDMTREEYVLLLQFFVVNKCQGFDDIDDEITEQMLYRYTMLGYYLYHELARVRNIPMNQLFANSETRSITTDRDSEQPDASTLQEMIDIQLW